MRSYWTDRRIEAAVATLLENLGGSGIPGPLLSAFLPDQFNRVRDGVLAPDPKSVVLDRIQGVLRAYRDACRVAGAPGARHVLTTQSAG